MENPSIATEHFLVYGTLRPGCGNYDGFFPYVAHSVRTVRIPGFAMYGNRGFPYAVRATATDTIECSLITVADTPDNVRYLMAGLDRLEGYDPSRSFNHYDRIVIDVDGVSAHLYVASDTFRDNHVFDLPRLESGNWHDASAPTGGAYMWVYPGEDESIVPDDSVEARFANSAPEEIAVDYEDESEDLYDSGSYTMTYAGIG